MLEVRDRDDQPLSGARIDLFRGKPSPIWYGKVFLNSADAIYFTDSEGHAEMGSTPLSGGAAMVHTFGHSNAVILLRVSSGGSTEYHFFAE